MNCGDRFDMAERSNQQRESSGCRLATTPLEGDVVETSVIDVLEPTVNRLFAATLDLSSIAAASDSATAHRLFAVVTAIDGTIRQLRKDLVAQHDTHFAVDDMADAGVGRSRILPRRIA